MRDEACSALKYNRGPHNARRHKPDHHELWGCSLSRYEDGGRSPVLSAQTCGLCASQARVSSTTSTAASAQLVRGITFRASWHPTSSLDARWLTKILRLVLKAVRTADCGFFMALCRCEAVQGISEAVQGRIGRLACLRQAPAAAHAGPKAKATAKPCCCQRCS